MSVGAPSTWSSDRALTNPPLPKQRTLENIHQLRKVKLDQSQTTSDSDLSTSVDFSSTPTNSDGDLRVGIVTDSSAPSSQNNSGAPNKGGAPSNTGVLAPNAWECPNVKEITLNRQPYEVEYLNQGMFACTYKIKRSISGRYWIAKTNKAKGVPISDQEIQNLKDIGEYYDTVESNGRSFQIIAYIDGKRIYEMDEWAKTIGLNPDGTPKMHLDAQTMRDARAAKQDAVKAVEACQNLITKYAEAAADGVVDYWWRSKKMHGDNHWGNFLFVQTGATLTGKPVDWGDIRSLDGPEPATKEEAEGEIGVRVGMHYDKARHVLTVPLQRVVYDELLYTSQLPVYDFTKDRDDGRESLWYGVCDSDALVNGVDSSKFVVRPAFPPEILRVQQ
ncbi:hypothetical protein FRB99_008312 [Tulasnella sp. 403]|nr:hypothetical protein FRB99_008312 [Tulasnella sp. 403]